MRIPLTFDSSRTSVTLLPVLIVKERLATPSFLIDTGSEKTTLSCRDAKAMGIDFANMEESEESSLTYAGYVKPLRLRNAEFLLNAEGGRIIVNRLVSIDVLPPTGNRVLDDSLPSAFGMDFLNECSYSLYVCPKKSEAFLERC